MSTPPYSRPPRLRAEQAPGELEWSLRHSQEFAENSVDENGKYPMRGCVGYSETGQGAWWAHSISSTHHWKQMTKLPGQGPATPPQCALGPHTSHAAIAGTNQCNRVRSQFLSWWWGEKDSSPFLLQRPILPWGRGLQRKQLNLLISPL